MAVTAAEVELVALLRVGDAEAFDHFVGTYAPRIRRWAGRMVADPADIEDITQEVLFASWRTAQNLRDDTVLAPWLKTITDNACRMRARRMSRKPSIPTGLAPEGGRHTEPVDVAQTVAVEAALAMMPVREADILRLLYADDRSLEDAARILCVSPDAAKSLAARARRRFRAHFEAWFRGLGAFVYSAGRLFDVAERGTSDAVKAGVAAVVAAATVASVAGPPAPPAASAERPRATAAASKPRASASPLLNTKRIAGPEAPRPGPAMLSSGTFQSQMAPQSTMSPEWSHWAQENKDEWQQWWLSAWAPKQQATPAPAPSASPQASEASATPAPSESPPPSASADPKPSASAPAPSASAPSASAPAPSASASTQTSSAETEPQASEGPAPSSVPTSATTPAPWWTFEWLAAKPPAAQSQAESATPAPWWSLDAWLPKQSNS